MEVAPIHRVNNAGQSGGFPVFLVRAELGLDLPPVVARKSHLNDFYMFRRSEAQFQRLRS